MLTHQRQDSLYYPLKSALVSLTLQQVLFQSHKKIAQIATYPRREKTSDSLRPPALARSPSWMSQQTAPPPGTGTASQFICIGKEGPVLYGINPLLASAPPRPLSHFPEGAQLLLLLLAWLSDMCHLWLWSWLQLSSVTGFPCACGSTDKGFWNHKMWLWALKGLVLLCAEKWRRKRKATRGI